MVTKTEHIPSRRTANQREVVRNKNQASVNTDEITYEISSASILLRFQNVTALQRPGLWMGMIKKVKIHNWNISIYNCFHSHLSEDLDIHQTFAESAAGPWRHGWCSGLGEKTKGGRTQDCGLERNTWTHNICQHSNKLVNIGFNTPKTFFNTNAFLIIYWLWLWRLVSYVLQFSSQHMTFESSAKVNFSSELILTWTCRASNKHLLSCQAGLVSGKAVI